MRRILCAVLMVACAAPGAAQEDAEQGSWERIPLGEHVWTGFTHAVGIGESAYFLHGRTIDCRRGDGSWERWEDVLPYPVSAFSAALSDSKGNIVVLPGNEKPGFVLDVRTRKVIKTYPALAIKTRRGCQLELDDNDIPHVAIGGCSKSWGRVVNGKWEELAPLNTVTALGMFSAGLYFIGDRFLAFGDHHVNNYFLETKSWPHMGKLYTQLGIRPALDRGGMGCQDPDSGTICLTLGKGSRALGVILMSTGRYHHVRPRLPFPLWDEDRSLYITGAGNTKRINLLSRREGAIFRLRVSELRRIGADGDKSADTGSPWMVWNTSVNGSHGDLARERDSVCNLVFIDPFIYVQRKNIVRQIHYKTIKHSKAQAGYKYGNRFATIGAALCYDGSKRVYLCNGNTKDFWAIDLMEHRDNPGVDTGELRAISEVRTRELAALQDPLLKPPLNTYSSTKFINNENGGGNTSMVFYDQEVYAVFDPVTRILWRYSPEQDRWFQEGILPAGLLYDSRSGIDMFVHDGRLWVLSKNCLSSYARDTGWSEVEPLDFEYSSDGGMACFDPETQMVYVALGAGSRDLATIHLPSRTQKVLEDYFPDCVSVHGRRIYIGRLEGKKYLSIFRGHDSAEHWRMELPADGKL